MIHYHGTPLSGDGVQTVQVLTGRHAFVSFVSPRDLARAIEVCQSLALDNGAFTSWKNGHPIKDWTPFYSWCQAAFRYPNVDWACVPDIIDGGESDNDALISEWPFGKDRGVPVWHLHESLDRLAKLAADWPRVALGSSGRFASVGTPDWWARIDDALCIVCDYEGYPRVRLHGLRMLNPKIFTQIPLASADSTNVGRNMGIDKAWQGTYLPPTTGWRGSVLAARIEAWNSATRWVRRGTLVSAPSGFDPITAYDY